MTQWRFPAFASAASFSDTFLPRVRLGHIAGGRGLCVVEATRGGEPLKIERLSVPYLLG